MNYRTLQHAQMSVSTISLGGNIFGHFTNQQETENLIQEAHDLGINFIDTADVYSEGQSETLIGNALKSTRSSWIIATKVGISSSATPAGLGKKSKIIEACEASLKRLQTEYIDLLQIHNFDPTTPLEETLDAFSTLIDSGKILAFGLSNYTMPELETLFSKMLPVTPISLQIPYNAFHRDPEFNIIPFCRKHDIAVLPYNVLARGILTNKYLNTPTPPQGSRATTSPSIKEALVPEVLDVVRELNNLAQSLQLTLSQMIIAWTLQHPGIVSLPLGMRNSEQLQDNVKAASVNLGKKTTADINKILDAASSKLTQYPLTTLVPKCS